MKNVRRYVELWVKHSLLGQTPTLVYSMERSGSVALYRSLSEQTHFAVCTHYLDPAKLEFEPQSGSAQWAYKNVVAKQRPVKVISLVRHPVENMLSIFARARFAGGTDESRPEADSSEELSRLFVTEYLEQGRHRRQLDWFHDEFEPTLGVDVYQHPFDAEQGLVQFQEGCLDVLILRTEMPDEEKSRHVAAFLGLPHFSMLKANSYLSKGKDSTPGMPASQTNYGAAYQQLKEHASIPPHFLTEIVDSRYVQHFFSERQREALRQRYASPTGAAG